MKHSLYLLISAITTLILFSCQNIASEKDYKNVTKDVCQCITKVTDKISPQLLNIIALSSSDEKAAEAAMAQYMEDDPMNALTEIMVIDSLGKSMESCISDLEKKYGDLYSLENDKEIQNKVLEIMKNDKSCSTAYGLMKLGFKTQGQQ